MSEITERYKDHKEANKEHRRNMLAKADVEGWKRHTEWHFSRIFNGKRMDWWPSRGKAMYHGRMIYGHKEVNVLIARLKKEEAENE